MTLNETCAAMAASGCKKGLAATRSPAAYFMGTVFAGAYIGIALVLAYTCAAGLAPGVRPLVLGSVFGIGLLLVIFAGAELFTGGVMYGAFGLAKRTMTPADVVVMLALMWVGNLVGSALLGWVFSSGGGGVIFSTKDFLQGVVAKKVYVDPLALVARSSLCNWLVCLAIWTPARVQNEAAKVILTAWCLLAFVACGFEHSVANMTAFTLALLQPGHHAVTLYGAAYNLLWVTLGNVIGGGLFVAGAYLFYAQTEAAPVPTPAATFGRLAEADGNRTHQAF